MDDFLHDVPKSTHTCTSVEDLQSQLSSIRDSKVTESKAAHITATFEFRSAAVFHVPDKENDGVEGNQNLESGSSAATPDTPAIPTANTTTREVRAHETFMNQPTDDPSLQKAVAKNIITSLGFVDGSTWAVRSVSRTASGWTFQYHCKNSMQAWMRQNSKNAAKVLVGESSGKDGQDPVLLARPAFDCRGSVTIAFGKSSRMITVKLEHTPLHKTVAELAELYKPSPPPARAEVIRRNRDSKKGKENANGEQNGEEAPKKKRKKPVIAAEDTTAEGDAAPKPKRPRPSRVKKKKTAASEGDGDQSNALLNLSPSEAARRRDEATRKLSDAGIDPTTLSSEQFDIFSNQSPDLQAESLNMLIKYGAERLRIVHPNKDTPASSSPTQANASTPDGSGKKKKSKKKVLNEDGTPKVKKTRGSCQACRAKKVKCSKEKPECTECLGAGIACYYPPQQSRKPLKSAEVVEDETDQPATDAPAPAPIPGPQAGPQAVTQPAHEPEPEEEASDLGSPGFSGLHSPAQDIVSQQHHDTSTNYADNPQDMYPMATGGLSYPQAVQDDMSDGIDYSSYSAQSVQQHSAPSGMAYPQQPQPDTSTAYQAQLNAPPPDPAPEPVQPVQPIQTVQPVQPPQPARAASSRSGGRRNLPSGAQQNNSNGYSNTAGNGIAPGPAWQSTNAAASSTQAYSASPSTRSARSRKQAPAPIAPTYDASQHEGLQAASTLSRAALQKTHASPTTRTESPLQAPTQAANVARAKSRHGHKAHSRGTASPFQQTSSAQSSVDATAIYNSSTTTDGNNTPNYDQYQRFNAATTRSSQPSSRVAYDYTQQTATSNSSASYPSYDAYTSRTQAPSTGSLAAPVTQPMPSASYSKTAAASSSSGWPNSTSRRGGNSYAASNAESNTNAAYNMPTSSTQQQPSAMQSFNGRPQSNAHPLRTNTPTVYNSQQRTQQSRQQQQPSYSAYPSQSQGSSNQQQQQQQQDWYGFGSSNNAASTYGSNARGSGYGQSGSGNNYSQRAMNLSGNTYRSMPEQELYDMLRNGPSH